MFFFASFFHEFIRINILARRANWSILNQNIGQMIQDTNRNKNTPTTTTKMCVMCLLITEIGAENVQNTHWITWSADSRFANDYILGFRLSSPWITVFRIICSQSFINNASYILWMGFWAIVMIAWTFTQLSQCLEGIFIELVFMLINVIVTFVCNIIVCLLCVLVRLHDAKYTYYGIFLQKFPVISLQKLF